MSVEKYINSLRKINVTPTKHYNTIVFLRVFTSLIDTNRTMCFVLAVLTKNRMAIG